MDQTKWSQPTNRAWEQQIRIDLHQVMRERGQGEGEEGGGKRKEEEGEGGGGRGEWLLGIERKEERERRMEGRKGGGRREER